VHGQAQAADPDFSTDYVWTRGPGRMMGVMLCRDARAERDVVLKAFRYVGVHHRTADTEAEQAVIPFFCYYSRKRHSSTTKKK